MNGMRFPVWATALTLLNPLIAGSEQPVDAEARKGVAGACVATTFDELGGVDLQTATVLDVQRALAGHKFSSVDLVQHQLALIGRFNSAGPALNAIRALDQTALDQARDADVRRARGRSSGPLDGITVLLKDNVGTTDLPTTAGSIALATNVPVREATITRRLRDAGAIVLGKTNLSEFANWMATGRMPNGYSSLGGQVEAPYTWVDANTFSDPSGSSSGSGVGGTMGFTTVAVGTETSGSIISPSETNSLVGVKPTLGLVSRIGIIPLAPSFDTAGPMARNVTDAALLLQALAFADPEDPVSQRFVTALGGKAPDYLAALSPTALKGARLGIRQMDTQPYGPPLQGPALNLYLQALDVLKAQGAEIVEINDPLFVLDNPPLTELGAIFNEFKISLNHYLAHEAGPATFVKTLSDIIAYNDQHPDKVKYGQYNLQISDAQSGSDMDPIELAARNAAILSAQAYIDQVMNFYQLDAIVGWDFNSNVPATAAAGYPNVTVPMGYDGNTPHGIEFAARPFEEARLLGYAYAYEQGSHMRQAPPKVNPALLNGCQ